MAAESSATPSAALRQIAIDAPKYRAYRPLDANQREIRVLDLGPDLRCTMRTVSLTSLPPYFALSYCWGPPGSTKDLIIESAEAEAEVVPIRKTLAKFLKSLYRQIGAITVWLDVICIDQRSVAEQSAQVAMMGDIYRLATAVYAWMGPWDPDIEYCFRYAAATPPPNQPDIEYDLTKIAASIDLLFARPYWSRLWIIQECVINESLILVCGHFFAEWESIKTTISQARWKVDIPRGQPYGGYRWSDAHEPIRPRSMMQSLRTPGSFTPKSSILELAWRYGAAGCADPRDSIYGFRALARNGHELPVDYASGTFDLLIQTVSLHKKNEYCRRTLAHEVYAPQYDPSKRSETDLARDESQTKTEDSILMFAAGIWRNMLLQPDAVITEMRALPSDFLIMPVINTGHHKSEYWIVQTHTTQTPPARGAPGFSSDYGFLARIDGNGRISKANHTSRGRYSSTRGEVSEPLFEGHIWTCAVRRAVHCTRLFYLYCILEKSRDTRAVEKLFATNANATRSDGQPRHCNCDKSLRYHIPAPWVVSDENITNDDESPLASFASRLLGR